MTVAKLLLQNSDESNFYDWGHHSRRSCVQGLQYRCSTAGLLFGSDLPFESNPTVCCHAASHWLLLRPGSLPLPISSVSPHQALPVQRGNPSPRPPNHSPANSTFTAGQIHKTQILASCLHGSSGAFINRCSINIWDMKGVGDALRSLNPRLMILPWQASGENNSKSEWKPAQDPEKSPRFPDQARPCQQRR